MFVLQLLRKEDLRLRLVSQECFPYSFLTISEYLQRW